MKKIITSITLCFSIYITSYATAPFSLQQNLFNQSNTVNLDLAKAAGTETITIFKPSATTNHFSNGVVITAFKNQLYCMWQSSATDEDATDTWVAYSVSSNGTDWSAPKILANNAPRGIYTSGGWFVRNDSLIAYINTWPGLSPKGGYTQYKSTADGNSWSALKPVRMLTGDTLKAIIEQDPHLLKNGRIINAAHFQPGLNVAPIYTDDASGVRGWVKASYTNLSTGSNSQEMEPSSFVQSDGNLVMIFRDQNSSYLKLAATSTNNGNSWSTAVLTNMPDSRSKQCAGNLPDGTAYLVSNPVTNKTRIPLALTLSSDGKTFTKAFVLREGGTDLQAQQYTGSAKSLGYSYPKAHVWGSYLYVTYSTNKEDVELTRIPLTAISQNNYSNIDENTANNQSLSVYPDTNGNTHLLFGNQGCKSFISIYNINGQLILQDMCVDGKFKATLPRGIYITRITTATLTISKLFEVEN